MKETGTWFRLAPLVSFDDYDAAGLLVDLRQGIWEELQERDTHLLSAILQSSSLSEAIKRLEQHAQTCSREHFHEADLFCVAERLQKKGFLEGQPIQTGNPPFHALPASSKPCEPPPFPLITWYQRWQGAGQIIGVLNELRKTPDGLFQAYQYIQKLARDQTTRERDQMLSAERLVQRAQREYGWYRLITGLVEYRVVHLLGQRPGEEGFCLVRSFALCAYLLSLEIPATMVLARPKYTITHFRFHVWVEIAGIPVNEPPNIRDGFRVLFAFPTCSSTANTLCTRS